MYGIGLQEVSVLIKTMKAILLTCFSIFLHANAIAAEQIAKADEAKKQPLDIKVYAINCGRADFKDIRDFSDTGEYDNQPAGLSNPCILIRHPKGNLLWDTGLSDDVVGKPQKGEGVVYSKSMKFADALAKIGLSPKDINFVTVSHLHFEHAANLNLFKDSTWLLQKDELKYANDDPPSIVIVPSKFSQWNSVQKKIIDGDYDVFGDGTVVFLKTPGHTPGHQVLKVKLPKSGTIIFSGDEYHQRRSFEPKLRIPTFNTSRAETMASADRIKTILQNTHGRLIIQHDEKDFNGIPEFPAFLN